jgi:hypothetical protein
MTDRQCEAPKSSRLSESRIHPRQQVAEGLRLLVNEAPRVYEKVRHDGQLRPAPKTKATNDNQAKGLIFSHIAGFILLFALLILVNNCKRDPFTKNATLAGLKLVGEVKKKAAPHGAALQF